MAIIATRLNSDGTLLINGNLDEVTYNGSTSSSVVKQQPDSISIQGIFDEVTFNAIDPAIKNQLTYTETFNFPPWNITELNKISNAIEAPNREFLSAKFIETTATVHFLLLDSTIVSGVTYVHSVFVKAAERTFFHISPSTRFTTSDCWANFDLTSKTYSIQGANTLGLTAGIIDVGNGWFRCWASMAGTSNGQGRMAFGPTTSLTTGRLGAYTGDGASGIYIWGAQIEIGSTPTIYQGIANTGTLVTSSIARKIDNQGNYYLKNQFDEFTGAPVVDPSLVFWLDAAQPISYSGVGNTWTSIVNSTYTGILNNGLVFNSQNGGFLTFDGVDDNVFFSSPGLTTSTTVATIEMLANIKQTGARMPFGFVGYDVYLAAGAMGYNTGNSDSYGINAATVTSLGIVGNWKHYAFVMKNNVNLTTNPYTSNKIYVNGVNQTLTQILNTQGGTTRTFNNGDGVISGWRNLDATTTTYRIPMDLAIFKIYNRELSEDEIQQNFNALRRRYNI